MAKKRRAKRDRPTHSEVIDAGPPERSQHHAIVMETTGLKAGEVRLFNRTHSPLDAYLHRKLLGEGNIAKARFNAGDTFRNYFERSGASPHVVSTLERVSGGEKEWNEGQLRAREGFKRAVQAIGKLSSVVAIDVCCMGISVTDVERRMGWRKDSGMQMLCMALDELAEHFGLIRRTVKWHAPFIALSGSGSVQVSTMVEDTDAA